MAGTALPRFCPRCGAPAGGSRFCGRCGNALAMSTSRSSTYEVAVPAAVRSLFGGKTGTKLWIAVIGCMTLLLTATAAVSFALASATAPNARCIVVCGRPVLAAPVDPPYRYTSSAYGYSVSLEYALSASDGPIMKLVVMNDRSIGWLVTSRYHPERGSWPFVFSGEPAKGRSAEEIATALVHAEHPDAIFVYSIPQSELGYTPGYGAVYDLTIRIGTGQSAHARVVVEVAIKRGLAVILDGIGPYVKSAPDAYGHPNPAATPMTSYFVDAANSVTWPGDPPL
jgi:hypothetical protein